MRFECEQGAGSAETLGEAERPHDHPRMAAMKPVKIADRNGRALQPRRGVGRVHRDDEGLMNFAQATIDWGRAVTPPRGFRAAVPRRAARRGRRPIPYAPESLHLS